MGDVCSVILVDEDHCSSAASVSPFVAVCGVAVAEFAQCSDYVVWREPRFRQADDVVLAVVLERSELARFVDN
jgi:hypothetical protein